MARNVAMVLGTPLLLAGLGLPNASGDPPYDAFTKELKALAGTWRPVSAENNGFKASEEDLKGTRWTRDVDGKWVMRRGDEAVVWWAVKKIDATKNPKLIDIEVTAGPHKGVSSGQFTILEFPAVGSTSPEPTTIYCESLTGALYLDKLNEVETYESIWVALEAIALSQTDSDDLIGTIIRESNGVKQSDG